MAPVGDEGISMTGDGKTIGITASRTKWRGRQVLATGATLALSASLCIGCGSDDGAAGERKPSMVQTAAPIERSGPNSVPVIESIALMPASPAPGRTIKAKAAVVDSDGDRTTVRYVWQDAHGRELGEGRSFDTTGLEPGDRLEVVAVASDGIGESEEYSESISLSEGSIEVALVVIDDSEGTQPGAILEAVVESTDESAGGYDVEYEWLVGDRVVGTDDELDTSSLNVGDRVVLSARFVFDNRATRPVRSPAVVLARGDAPQIVSTPEGGIEGGVFRYQMRATSPESAAELSYEVISGPEGMTVGRSSGLVTWRPGADQRGAFEIEVVAKDQWGSGAAQSFEIRVDGPAAPPASAR